MSGALKDIGARATAELLVLLDVDVYRQHAHHLSQDEGQPAEVEGPAVGVVPLLVLVLFGRDVAECRRDVYNDAYDVAQAWINSRQNLFFVCLGQQFYF